MKRINRKVCKESYTVLGDRYRERKGAMENLQEINEKLDWIINNMGEPKQVYTLTEALDYLCIGRTMLSKEINAGKIRFKKKGASYLFKRQWLDDWMER